MTRVGIDAHKKSCTACVFNDDDALASRPSKTFTFRTTKRGVSEFMEEVPRGSIVVIESSTTGKVISRMLSPYYEVHMIAPPEKKPSVKTDKRDSERIVREDMLGYVRRCYIPSPYIEGLRFIVSKQMEIGEKISRAKDQIHALLERNMLQSEFEDLSDIFGAEGLERLSSIELSEQERTVLAMYLEELNLYTSQHKQIESEIAKVAEADGDCQILMSHPGIASFVAVAIKARVGDDASRFPTKKHFSSYAGVVPKADNSGERVSEHRPVKHGDDVLKYALTCGVRGAVHAKASSAVKTFYLKQIAKGKSPQDAQVAAARKLSWIVWKMLTTKTRYAEEDEYLTARKTSKLSKIARKPLKHAVRPEDVPILIRSLMPEAAVLQRYPENMHRMLGHHRGRGKNNDNSSNENISQAGGVVEK
jgi:transposase